MLLQGLNLSTSPSSSVGGIVVMNDVRGGSDAEIRNSTLITAGDVLVSASESALINATVDNAVTASGGSSIGDLGKDKKKGGTGENADVPDKTTKDVGKGQDTSGAEDPTKIDSKAAKEPAGEEEPEDNVLAVSGNIATNVVLSTAKATISSSTVTTSPITTADGVIATGAVTVAAVDDAEIISDTKNSAYTTGGNTYGVTLAFNSVGYDPQNLLFNGLDAIIGDGLFANQISHGENPAGAEASITNSQITASGAVGVTADNKAIIDATVSNKATSESTSIYGTDGKAVGMMLASNKVSAKATASIDNSNSPTLGVTGTSFNVDAKDDAEITSKSDVLVQTLIKDDYGVSIASNLILLAVDNYQFTTASGYQNVKNGDLLANPADLDSDGKPALYQYTGTDAPINLSSLDFSGNTPPANWVRYIVGDVVKNIVDNIPGLADGSALGVGGLLILNQVKGGADATIKNADLTVTKDYKFTATSGSKAVTKGDVIAASFDQTTGKPTLYVYTGANATLNLSNLDFTGNTPPTGWVLFVDDNAGDVTVKAQEISVIDATASGTVETTGSGNGSSIAVNGIIATNNIMDFARASIVNGSISGAGADDVSVLADSASTLTATVDATTKSRQVGVGIVLAFNTVGVAGQNFLFNIADVIGGTDIAGPSSTDDVPVYARISGATIDIAGDLTVAATADETITADISNYIEIKRLSLSDENPPAVGVSAVIALNRISSGVDARLGDSSSIDVGGVVVVSAINSSTINAKVVAPSIVLSANPVSEEGATAISIALVIVRNEIGADVRAEIDKVSHLDASGDISVDAEQNSTIKATGAAAAVALVAGASNATGVTAGGVIAFNKIVGSVGATISDSTVDAGLTGGAVTVKAANAADIEATAVDAAVNLSIAAEAATGVAIGFVLAFNYVGYLGAITHLEGNSATDNPTNSNASLSPLSTAARIRNSKVTGKSVAVEASTTAKIDAVTGALALAAGLSAEATTTVAVAGVFNMNRVATNTIATIDGQRDIDSADTNGYDISNDHGHSTIDAGGGGVSVTADAGGEIIATDAAAAVTLSLGGEAATSISVGVSVALNNIANTVRAQISNSSVEQSGSVLVQATNDATIHATAVAAALAVAIGGEAGIAVAGGGAVATNDIAGTTLANLTNSSISSYGNVTVNATMQSTITAEIAAVAVALAFSPEASPAIALGVAVALNKINHGNSVEAALDNSSLTANSGRLIVSALSHNTIDAFVVAAAVAVAGGEVGLAASGAGAGSENDIAVATTARITGSGTNGISAAGVSVTAEDRSQITVTVAAGAVAAAFGEVGAGFAIGIAIATNDIANRITAEIIDAASLHGGAYGVLVDAKDQSGIHATAASASLAVAVGEVGVAISAGGAVALNKSTTSVLSKIDNSTITGDGGVSVTAESDATITANIAAVAAAIAGGQVGVGVAIGVSVAINQIGDWDDSAEQSASTGDSNDDDVSDVATAAPVLRANGGTSVVATINNSDVTASGGDVTVTATSGQTIEANVVALAAALAAGQVGIGVAGAGTYAENRVAVRTAATIEGISGNTADIHARNITVHSTDDLASITAFVGSAALSAAIGEVGVAGAAAIAVAKNVIANYVDAHTSYASLTAQAVPTHTANYKAFVFSAGPDGAFNTGDDLTPVEYTGQALGAGKDGIAGNVDDDYVALVDQNTTFEYGSVAPAPGNITISAHQGAVIDATAAAAAVALAGGAVGAALSVGGAVALNSITGSTSAYADHSSLTAGGDVGVTATNSMDIRTIVLAVSAAVGIGGAGFSAGVGASVALNYIGYGIGASKSDQDHLVGVSAYLSNSNVDSFGDLEVSATSSANIDATVAAAAVAVSAGAIAASVAAAGAVTINQVGMNVLAYIDNSGTNGDSVKAATIDVAADDNSTISVWAGAAAISASFGVFGSVAVSIGVAVATNSIDNEVGAYVRGVDTLTARGELDQSAYNAGNHYYYTSPVVTGYTVSGNVVTPTYVTGTPVIAGSGSLRVTANSVETVTATAYMASVAASFGVAIAGGGAVVLNDIKSSARSGESGARHGVFAYIDGGAVSATGDITVKADAKDSASGEVGAITVSIGLGLAASGADVENNIAVNVDADIGRVTSFNGRNVIVQATATPQASSLVRAVNVGAVAVGVSEAHANIANTVSASFGGASNASLINVQSLQVAALNLVGASGKSADAEAIGMVGGLIGVDATIAKASSHNSVNASIGAGTITASRNVGVGAENDSVQYANAVSVAFGLAAAGATTSDARSTGARTSAKIGGNVKINAGNVSVVSAGIDDNRADATPGSIGAVAIAAAVLTTDSTDTQTLAQVGDGTNVPTITVTRPTTQLVGESTDAFNQFEAVAGNFTLAADHLARANTQLVTTAYGLLSGSGATADNWIDSKVDTVVGLGAQIFAANIDIAAVNRFQKDDIGNNIDGSAGGLVSGAKARSDTHLTLNTKTAVNDNATVQVIGKSTDGGMLSIQALNDIVYRETVTYQSAGLGSGVDVHAGLDAGGELLGIEQDGLTAVVQIGTNPTTTNGNVTIKSAGALELGAHTTANAILNVSVDNYGGVTVSIAQAVVDIRPLNKVIIGKGDTVKGNLDVNLMAGESSGFDHDYYLSQVFSDTFAGSVIPISEMTTNSFIFIRNEIDNEGTVEAGGNIKAYADRDPFADITAQGKAVNWASSAIGALDSLLGGSSHNQTTGSAHENNHALVINNGTFKTGANRQIDILIADNPAYNPNLPFDAVTNNPVKATALNGTSLDGIDFSFQTVAQSTALFAELQADQDALSNYGYGAGANNDLKAFYQSEMARITAELVNNGYALELPENPNDPNNHNTIIVAVDQETPVVVISPIHAAAGYIDVRSDVFSGGGTLDAPGDVSVKIRNTSSASLDIQGITIPEDNGGVYFNGFLKRLGGNTDLNGNGSDELGANKTNAGADDGLAGVSAGEAKWAVQLAREGFSLAAGFNYTTGTLDDVTSDPTIDISNYHGLSQPVDKSGNPLPFTGITVSGAITAISATVTLATDEQPGGDITVNAEIDAKHLSIKTQGKLVIDLPAGSVFQSGGDPIDSWNNPVTQGMTPVGDNSSDPLNINRSTYAGLTYVADGSVSGGGYWIYNHGANGNGALNSLIAQGPAKGIFASQIDITAEYVNLNGLIQSGFDTYHVTIDGNAAAEIADIKAKIAQGRLPAGLNVINSASANGYKAYWDSVAGKVVLQPFQTPAGQITITGKLLNTGNGHIKVLGGYATVTVDNTTAYDVIVKRLDLSERGAGTIILNDKAKATGGDVYQRTTYKTYDDGRVTMTVENMRDATSGPGVNTQVVPSYVSVDTANTNGALSESGIGSSFNASTNYNPVSGWRYGWSVSSSIRQRITTTYGKSDWIGLDALAADPANIVDVKTEALTQPTLVPGSDYFFSTDPSATTGEYHTDPAYTFGTINVVSNSTTRDGNKWSTSTWYGKHTYYVQKITEQDVSTTTTQTIEADRPVSIQILGSTQATVTINSTGGGNVILQGSVLNETGNTTITTNGTLTQNSDDIRVQGVNVSLTANKGIGTSAQSINVDEVELYPDTDKYHGSLPVEAGTDGKFGTADDIHHQAPAIPSLTATANTGNVFIREIDGKMAIATVMASKGDVTLVADGAIVHAHTGAGLITGNSLTLTAGGGIGDNADGTLNLNSSNQQIGKVNLVAGGDIDVTETVGDLQLQKADANGHNVTITVTAGSLIDADNFVQKDVRSQQALLDLWHSLSLTGDGAAAKAEQAVQAYEDYKLSEYQNYWRLKANVVADHYTMSDAEKAYYQGRVGTDYATTQDADAAIIAIEQSRYVQYQSLAAVYSSYGNTYRSNIGDAYKLYLAYTSGNTTDSLYVAAFNRFTADGKQALVATREQDLTDYAEQHLTQTFRDEGTAVLTASFKSQLAAQIRQEVEAAGRTALAAQAAGLSLTGDAASNYVNDNLGGYLNGHLQAALDDQTTGLDARLAAQLPAYLTGHLDAYVDRAVADFVAQNLAFASALTTPATHVGVDGYVLTHFTAAANQTYIDSYVSAHQTADQTDLGLMFSHLPGGTTVDNFSYTATAPVTQANQVSDPRVYLFTPIDFANGLRQEVHVWSESELVNSLGSGLTKAVTDTQVTIENANIKGANVTVTVKTDIGTLTGSTIIQKVNGTLNLTDDDRVALGAAERQDLVYLSEFTQGATASFGSGQINGASYGTIKVSGAAFGSNANYAEGAYLYIAGDTVNATEGGAYYVIKAVSGDTIYVSGTIQIGNTTPSAVSSLANESGRKIDFGTVIADPMDPGTFSKTYSDDTQVTGSFVNTGYYQGQIQLGATLTGSLLNDLQAASADHPVKLYITGTPNTVNDTTSSTAFVAETKDPSGGYLLVTKISSDGKTITLQTGTIFTELTDVAFHIGKVTVAQVKDAPVMTAIVIINRDDVDMSVSGVLNAEAGHAIYIGSEDAIALGHVEAGGGTPQDNDNGLIEIKSSQAISNGAAAGVVNLKGTTIIIEAAHGAIGAGNKAVTVSGTEGGLTARAQESIWITAPTTSMYVASIYSERGDVFLTADQGDILDAFQDGNTGGAKIVARHVLLTATQGKIGTADNYLEIDITSDLATPNTADDIANVGTLTASGHKGVFLSETNGNMNVRGITADEGDVGLNAFKGSIVDAEYSTVTTEDSNHIITVVRGGVDITGNSITLEALIGIGGASQELEINSSVQYDASQSNPNGKLTAKTQTGSIYVTESTTGDLFLNQVGSGLAGGVTTLTFITAAAGSMLNGRVVASGGDTRNVTGGKTYLVAKNNIGASGNRIISGIANIETWSELESTWVLNLGGLEVGGVRDGTKPAAEAGGSIDIMATSPVTVSTSSIAHSGNITITAHDDNNDTGTAEDDALPDNVTILADVTLEATLGSIYVVAGDDVIIEDGAHLFAKNNIEISGDVHTGLNGDVDPDVGHGTIIDIAGDLHANGAIIIRGGADADSITIEHTARLRGETSILAGGGEDNVVVDRLASMVTYKGVDVALKPDSTARDFQRAINPGHDDDGRLLRDRLTIDGEGGTDHVLINVSGAADYVITVTDGGAANNGADVLDIEGVSAKIDLAGGQSGANIDLKQGDLVRANVTATYKYVGTEKLTDLSGIDFATDPHWVLATGTAEVDLAAGALAADVDIKTGDLVRAKTTATYRYVGEPGTADLEHADFTDTDNWVASRQDDDVFLLRKNFIAALQKTGVDGTTGFDKYANTFERINYDASINGRVIVGGNTGEDKFFLDDNAAVMTLDGGEDNDSFQVGQVFATDRGYDIHDQLETGDSSIPALEDRFKTTKTTLGYLSYGVTLPAVIYGGEGNDLFTVYSNHADLRLEGEDGNDTFIIRAFALADDVKIKVEGGSGDDVTQYNINAPVDIDGGAGFDKVVVLGTELADVFVVTKDGIYGAGLTIHVANAEAMELDGLEGDDTFYVLSTDKNVVTTIIGGLGSDTVNVAGDVVDRVVSQTTEGETGIISHSVESDDPAYAGLFVRGIDFTAKGDTTPALTVHDGGLTVREDIGPNDASYKDSYHLALPGTYDGAHPAYVTISAAQASAALRKLPHGGGATVEVSVDGGVTWADAVTVKFDGSNWTAGVDVLVRAKHDLAEEGIQKVAISHTVISDDPAINGFAIQNVLVTVIDNDKPGLVVTQSGSTTTVIEGSTLGAAGTNDDYSISLTKQPAVGEVVTVTVAINTPELLASTTTLHFSATGGLVGGFQTQKWDQAQTITLSSLGDSVLENRIEALVTHTINSVGGGSDAVYANATTGSEDEVGVEVIDGNTASVEIIETDGSTVVAKSGDTDKYTIKLTTPPASGKFVKVHIALDGKATVDLAASNAATNLANGAAAMRIGSDSNGFYALFDGTDARDVTIVLKFDPNGTAHTDGTRTFAVQPHELTKIAGPLFVIGGEGPEKRTLAHAVALPDEINVPVVVTPPVAGHEDFDRLNVYSDTTANSITGTLTDHTISGIGIGAGISTPLHVDYHDVNKPNVDLARIIDYKDFGVVEVLLGRGDDTFTVTSSNAATMTVVQGGGGSDLLQVRTTDTGPNAHTALGPIVFFGDTSADGVRYSATNTTVNGNGYAFTNYGNDTLDAGDARGIVVLDGGKGADHLTGGQYSDATSFIAGGIGNDIITGGVNGKNWILGDSAFSLETSKIDAEDDYRNHRVVIDDSAVIAAPTYDVNHVQTNTEVTGADTITIGNASNVVIGDHGMIQQDKLTGEVTLPAEGVLDMLNYREVVRIRTTSTSTGGDDSIETNANDPVEGRKNIIFGGFGNDNIIAGEGSSVIFGDNGEANFVNAKVTDAKSTDLAHGGSDTITALDGNHVIIGGSFADLIKAGGGNHVILGDSGEADFDSDGNVSKVFSLHNDDAQAGGFDLYDGIDNIEAHDGSDVVFGGGKGDTINIGSGASVVFGDSGYVELDNHLPVIAYSTDTGTGGDDIINTGVDFATDTTHAPDGDTIIVGGYGKDLVTAEDGNDIVFGDNAKLEFDTVLVGGVDTAVLQRGYTIDPANGDKDTIHTGKGRDLIIGGTGSDSIWAGDDDDWVFGDNGLYDVDLPDAQRIISIYATNDVGAGDVIYGEAGNDIIVGGQGGDTIDAGEGDDDVIGDNNIVGGAVGNDNILGGDGEDVILGDNGVIARTITDGTSWKDIVFKHDPTVLGISSIHRDVVRFDNADFLGGNDIIFGDAGNDLVFGQRGNDEIHGGFGDDGIIGGLGEDHLYGDGGKDIVLGDEGQILRAFTSNGGAQLNTDGTWHRDVVLEEVAHAVDAVAVSSNKGRESTLAADLLAADVLLLGGFLNADGSQMMVGTPSRWNTAVVGLNLEAAYNDYIEGGDQDDVLFGQRGDDTIKGGVGNDTIYGDRASNSAGFVTDLPGIINAYRIVTAVSALEFVLPVGGEIVVPAANLLPWEITPYLPQVDVFPNASGPLAGFAAKTDITLEAASRFTVFASIVPDVTRATGVVFGNDSIDGGDGKDTIFGDDARMGPIQETGLSVIDGEIAGLSVSMYNLLKDLSSMGFAVRAAENGAPTTVSFGNDIITGGGDNDTIYGDTGMIVVPASQIGLVGDTPSAAAVKLDHWLMDFETLVSDLSYTARGATEMIVRQFAIDHGVAGVPFVAGNSTLRPSTFTLDIGNDSIDGGTEDDLIIGDHGIIMVTVIAAGSAPALAGISNADLKTLNAALSADNKALTAKLKAHIAADHAIDTGKTSATTIGGNWVFGNGLGYGLNMGNDQIHGGQGNDVIVGDTGLMQQPNMLTGWTSKTSKSVADALQASFFKVIDRLYLGNLSSKTARAEAWGVQSVVTDWSGNGSASTWLLDTKDKRQAQLPAKSYITLNADRIWAEDGNDLVFGDFAALMPVVNKTGVAGMITTMRVLPIGETSASQTANLRYVYSFGAQGPLHSASANDVNRRMPFTIDADSILGGAGDDVIYGTLGDDYINGEGDNDQISGGNGYDIVDGGTGTNIFAFDRKRDKVGNDNLGKSIVRQRLDAASSALVLGSTWISPLTAAVAANAQTASASFVPNSMMAPRLGSLPKPASGVSTTAASINPLSTLPIYANPAVVNFLSTDRELVHPTIATIFGLSSQIVIRVANEEEEEDDEDDVMFFDDLTNALYPRRRRDDDIVFYD